MRLLSTWCLLLTTALTAADFTIHDERLTIELVAEQPQILTPTGVAVDERGRIWAVENNTHFRPKNYAGPEKDRILIFEDFDTNGRARKSTVFAEGFSDGMSLAIAPNGDIYFATRSLILLLRDKDGDGKCDEQKTLVTLETTCTYPHNALCGFAFGADGNVYFALGENLGAAYTLTGSDGTKLSGGGEGGSHYWCKPDGSQLTRICIGLWNTFHQTFDAFGRLFAVDNDPAAGQHCRLVHIVQGGDYGFRKRAGWDLSHPFVAWYGELPGTLPPVCNVNEAPTGIVCYEHVGLPADYYGKLIVNSWGDHTIDLYPLTERGASFGATKKEILVGPVDFRPSGMCLAPDGSIVITDWADASYTLHGKGRIWRLRAKSAPADDGLRVSAVRKMTDINKLNTLLGDKRKDIRTAAAETLAQRGKDGFKVLKKALGDDDPRVRVHALWASYHLPAKEAKEFIARGLKDEHAGIRVAALDCFKRQIPDEHSEKDVEKIALKDESTEVRMAAVLALRDTHLDVLTHLFDTDDPYLRSAAIEMAANTTNVNQLRELFTDNTQRALVIVMALRRKDPYPPARRIISELLPHADPQVRRAALHWVGEENVQEFAGDVDKALIGMVTPDVFTAYLTTQELLGKLDKAKRDEVILGFAFDDQRPLNLRALAFQAANPQHSLIDMKKMEAALWVTESDSLSVGDRRIPSLDALRFLAQRSDDASQALLRTVAVVPTASYPRRDDIPAAAKLFDAARAEAVAGLARSANHEETQQLLLNNAKTGSAPMKFEALRSLRGSSPKVASELMNSAPLIASDAALAEQLAFTLKSLQHAVPPELEKRLPKRPTTSEGWLAELKQGGDAAAGRRLFFHPRGAQCFVCHTVQGRGGKVGPELTTAGKTFTREQLISAIVEPGKDVAPNYIQWSVKTKKGDMFTGIFTDGAAGRLTFADSAGKLIRVNETEIEWRKPLKGSLMPDSLPETMTVQEMRDLVAFLATLGKTN